MMPGDAPERSSTSVSPGFCGAENAFLSAATFLRDVMWCVRMSALNVVVMVGVWGVKSKVKKNKPVTIDL
jgi:hypothetical protein